MQEYEIIRALRDGSEDAFRLLVEQYQNQVYNTCFGFVQNAEDAEEVAQDVFIEVYRSVGSFRGDSKLSTWIYRIATTKSLELIRKHKRKKRFAFLQSLGGSDSYETNQIASFEHPGVILENKENAKVLFNAIRQLPENQRIAFTLHKIEGLPYQEISEIMQASLSSVESMTFRARKNLQKSLKNFYEKNFT